MAFSRFVVVRLAFTERDGPFDFEVNVFVFQIPNVLAKLGTISFARVFERRFMSVEALFKFVFLSVRRYRSSKPILPI